MQMFAPLNDLSPAERIIVASAVVLIVTSLLPWFGAGHVSRDGWSNPLGGLAVLLASLMLLQISLVRRAHLDIPPLPITWGQAHLVMGAASFALILGQWLIGAHTTVGKLHVSLQGRGGLFFGLCAAAGLAYGGYRASREREHDTAS